MTTWDEASPGVMVLPSGRLVRGRGLRNGLPAGPLPTYSVYLLAKQPPEVAWKSHWFPAAEAVDFVRRNYDRHAVETPWQKRFVRRFIR